MTSPVDREHPRGVGALDGIVVIDLSRALAGPHATMMLADLGARVVKVELPATGDDSRGWGPPFVAPSDASYTVLPAGSGPVEGRESTYFLAANRNKESITLDLKSGDDRAILARLIERSDVLVENFRPGVLDRLGLDLATLRSLNKGLIVLSISGFGHDGPEGGRAGYDQIAQGESGLMSLTGARPDAPQKAGPPICDLLAGMYGAYGVLAALRERDRTGRGGVVRTSLLAAGVGVHAFHGTRWTVAREVSRATGNHHASIAPYGLFTCRDGAVQIAVGSEGLWRSLCAGFGLDPVAEGMGTNSERVGNKEALVATIEAVFAAWDAEPLLAHLAELGIPAGKVRTLDDVYAWPQAASQGLLIEVDHATLGPLTLPGPPLRFFDLDGHEVTRNRHTAPPVLGADNDAVRAWVDG